MSAQLHRTNRYGVEHESMLPAANLRCDDGHDHWTPTPDTFAERLCLTPTLRNVDKTPSIRGLCHARLHLVNVSATRRSSAPNRP